MKAWQTHHLDEPITKKNPKNPQTKQNKTKNPNPKAWPFLKKALCVWDCLKPISFFWDIALWWGSNAQYCLYITSVCKTWSEKKYRKEKDPLNCPKMYLGMKYRWKIYLGVFFSICSQVLSVLDFHLLTHTMIINPRLLLVIESLTKKKKNIIKTLVILDSTDMIWYP